MKNINFLTVLSLSAILFSATTTAAITGTDDVEMTFNATLTSTTCNAQIIDMAGTPTSIIDYGDVFKSEIANKSRVVQFKINYTDCSGISSLDIKAKPGAGGSCSGVNADGNSYAAGNNAAFELWYGNVDRDVEMLCSGKYYIMSGLLSKEHLRCSSAPVSSSPKEKILPRWIWCSLRPYHLCYYL